MVKKNWCYYKQIERKAASVFPGSRRTPLSGSNSGQTSADLLNTPYWIYVEVKRDLRYSRFWVRAGTTLLGLLRSGISFRPFPEAVAFHFPSIYEQKVATLLGAGDVIVRGSRRIERLFRDTQIKAEKEGKECVVLLFRVHGKRGFYGLVNADQAERLEEWIRKHGRKRWQAAKRPEVQSESNVFSSS